MMLFQRFKPANSELERTASLDFASRQKVLEAPLPDVAKDALCGNPASTISAQTENLAKPTKGLKEDSVLRMFDELL